MKPNRPVSIWLFILCVMVFGMVAGGGHARTIGAGFTIQVWQPFTGFIPPLTQQAWARQFALYQQTAQFHARPIALAQYKTLFWPMFVDRCWGRLMALVFLVPFAIFWARGRISHRLALWLLTIFAAGGAQAAFGWYMVRTGLEPGIVTPPAAWAAPHFFTAMLIFSALLWTALTVRKPSPDPVEAPHLKSWMAASIALILLTMGFGALVAATNAITVFNTFPLMNGQLIPSTLFSLHPTAENFLANQATVQFFHRLAATLTALTVLTSAVLGLREPTLSPALRDNFLILAALVALQYVLGMATIVLAAPNLGFIHELNAVLLLAAAITTRFNLRGTLSQGRLTPSNIPVTGAE